jgi:hypothetical protein
LPGRVHPYRPDRIGVAAGPTVWVDAVNTAPALIGAAATGTDVTVTVWALADGANHAAQAMLDNLHAAIHDAAAAAGYGWNSGTWTTFDVDADTTVPALTVELSQTVYVVTFCELALPTAVPIPPVLVEV